MKERIGRKKMDIFEQVDVHDCPICGGASLLEEENGNSFYVMCMDCGSRTVNVSYQSENEKLSAAQRAALLWNTGKAINSSPGE